MRTPGFLKDNLFYLRTLVILSALSIGLQIHNRVVNTSAENISGQNESLEITAVVPEEGELRLKVTGKNTTVVVQSLRQILKNMGVLDSKEKFFLSTPL